MSFPATANVIDITANGNTGDFSFGTHLPVGSAGFQELDDFGVTTYPVKIAWNAWSGFYQLDATDKDIITGSTSPISITQDIDTEASPEIDWDLKLGQYQWSLNGGTDTVRFDLAYTADFKSKDVLTVFNSGEVGDLKVEKALGTEVQFLSGTNGFLQERWQVKTGSVTLSSGLTGAYADLNTFKYGGKIEFGNLDPDNSALRDSFTFDRDNINSRPIPIQRTFSF